MLLILISLIRSLSLSFSLFLCTLYILVLLAVCVCVHERKCLIRLYHSEWTIKAHNNWRKTTTMETKVAATWTHTHTHILHSLLHYILLKSLKDYTVAYPLARLLKCEHFHDMLFHPVQQRLSMYHIYVKFSKR